MMSIVRMLIRWGSYPIVFGGCSFFMIWTLYASMPSWPLVPIAAGIGLFVIAGLERLQPYRTV